MSEVAPELDRAVGIFREPPRETILPVAILYVTMVANYGIRAQFKYIRMYNINLYKILRHNQCSYVVS